jgi:Uma2 family endonuclease
MSTPTSVLPADEIVYPDSDGKPMADNTEQFSWIVRIKEGHEVLYEDDEDVFVAGDLLWYPVEGHPEICAAPDTLLAFGRPKGRRGSYMQWREGNVAPQVVWEVLSPNNTRAELQEKFGFYQRYGVAEYYQYDPDRGRLRGWLRRGDVLEEIAAIQGWVSPRTGVRMALEGTELVLTYPNGEPFRTLAEHNRLRLEALARADQERQRAEQERQRAEQERQRAEQEHQERAAAEELAEQERRQRAAAEELAEQERRQRAAAEELAEQERRQRAAAERRAESLAARLREMGIDPER